ncbi:tRNA-splicing endonuclease subunit sen2-1 [Phtheirospermum japonicum]|uniref:tRNA-splicing endonuclease subunit sen2-1 n=1 Tax=Phtheirospermum japonicum TaxID=374723 RepID=A0A830CSG8_9LAMI|nr:tRNA-splicing endonuclease subunit sen2-1 [Phtheirospermum japonicum]
MISKKADFPYLFKAYSHLRVKNWVVGLGFSTVSTFLPIDIIRPALVHSEYAVLVLSGKDGCRNSRLKAWSDFHYTSVAKTLLVLHISNKSHSAVCSSCLECYCVDERIWIVSLLVLSTSRYLKKSLPSSAVRRTMYMDPPRNVKTFKYNIQSQQPIFSSGSSSIDQTHHPLHYIRSFSHNKSSAHLEDLSLSSYLKPKDTDHDTEISIFNA